MSELFPGLAALENLHPVFVHFPLVLLPLALVFQLLGMLRKSHEWQRVALVLLVLGTVGAAAAVLSGLEAEEEVEVPEAAVEAIEQHEILMKICGGFALLLTVLGLLGRRFEARAMPVILLAGLALLNGLLVIGADRGALLVYKHGVSVAKPAGPGGPP